MKILVAKPQRRIRGKLKSWYARVQYVDDDGQNRGIFRKAKDKADAQDMVRRHVQELKDHGHRIIEADHLLFSQVAELYTKTKLIPAKYRDNRKIAGLRNHQTPKGFVLTLVEHFGRKNIKNISHSDIERFKQLRLDTETKNGTPRRIASINRELETLRGVMNFAERSGWLIKNPFKAGDPLISKSDETHRERVLTQGEEQRLLEVCTSHREHLRPLIVTALDTAMRRGELFKLTWNDVDFGSGLIRIQAMNSKTMKHREVPMTRRVAEELRRLMDVKRPGLSELVFGITDTIKTAFGTACKLAQIDNLRFHDFRHSAITRMVAAGIPPAEVMKITGHTQMSTFLRYLNPTGQRKRTAAEMLTAYLESESQIVSSGSEEDEIIN